MIESLSKVGPDPLHRMPTYHLQIFQVKLRETEDLSSRNALMLHRLAATLDLSRGSATTDKRDKVYGILSLLPRCVSSLVEVDYSMPISHVYKSFTRSVAEGTGNLDILDHCSWSPELPSWCPDWREDSHTRIFPGIKTTKPFEICSSIPMEVNLWTLENAIQVKGCEVDLIDGVSRASAEMTTDTSPQGFQQTIGNTSNCAGDSLGICNAFWRTLTANLNRNGDRVPDSSCCILGLFTSQLSGEHAHNINSKRLGYLGQLMDRCGDLLVAGVPLLQHAKESASAWMNVTSDSRKEDTEHAIERMYRCTRIRRWP
jgi:hypothetical protein